MKRGQVMGDMKKLVGLCVALTMIITGSIAVAQPVEKAGKTKIIKSKGSGSFVDANFDFDHSNLSTPASYINGDALSNAGRFTTQAVDEFALGKTCTLPGGAPGAGTEYTFLQDVGVSRFTETGDLLFFKATSGTECVDFSTFPTPPFPFVATETGVFTGGTGAYSGATGTYSLKIKGATLSIDATGVRTFGWFKDTGVATVIIP
jgi:hypothetical protein